MKQSTMILLMLFSILSHGEHYINLGVITRHYIQDNPNYNEDNQLIQYTHKGQIDLSIATFENSRFYRSYALGVGEHWMMADIEIGYSVGVVTGYKEFKMTQKIGFMLAPVFYAKKKMFKVMVMGNAINIGIEQRI